MSRLLDRPGVPVSSREGFTLVELAIVVVILGILVTIIAAGVTQARQQASDRTALSDIRNAASYVELYFRRNGSWPSTYADLQSEGYETSPRVQFTTFTPSFNAEGTWQVLMRTEHMESDYYYQWTYPTEGAPQRIPK